MFPIALRRMRTVRALLGLCIFAGVASGDDQCGDPPAPLNASIPNVLLIGDSISMGTGQSPGTPPYTPLGYGWGVRDALAVADIAQVQHNGGWYIGGQAGPSTKGVQCIEHWLGAGNKWDVVHLNHGLHDVDKSEFVPPEKYVANLDAVYSKIVAALKPGGQFIWASSTPVPWPSEYALRNNSAVQHYNTLAAQLWASKPGVVTNDLYHLITERCGSGGALGSYASCSLQRQWSGPPSQPPKPGTTGGVHYNARGRQYMALAVASIISQHLPTAGNRSSA